MNEKWNEFIEDFRKSAFNKQDIFWVDSPIEFIKKGSNKLKGKFGESVIDQYCIQSDIAYRLSENPDHDRIINGIKSEIKYSTICFSVTKRDYGNYKNITFFQIRPFQDYQQYYFVVAFPNMLELYWCDKQYLADYFDTVSPREITQIGGKKVSTRLIEEHGDDWMKHNLVFHWCVTYNKFIDVIPKQYEIPLDF